MTDIFNRRVFTAVLALGTTAAAPGLAQSWTATTNAPSFNTGASLVLTDGRVLVQDQGTSNAGGANFWVLQPDNTGSYINGTWKQVASLPAGYAPLYHASAVLPDGRVIIDGGEYNGTSSGVWTNKSAIYDPIANTWTAVAPPAGWSTIGDAQSAVLADGTYMLANCCTTQEALLNATTLTWTTTGTGKADINDEEGWGLLPDNSLLTVDANDTADLKHTERYVAGAWASAGDVPVQLADLNSGGGGSHELGALVLRPDGTVFAGGATAHTAVYNTTAHSWAAGPDYPIVGGAQLDSTDGPGSVLPNGNVLIGLSPGLFNPPTSFFEFDGTSMIAAPGFAAAASQPSFSFKTVILPTGQILATYGNHAVEIYTGTGKPKAAWKPTIRNFTSTATRGSTYTLKGLRLNGMTQGSGYGDDYQSATNYPLVRITNLATGQVKYARTSKHSSMAVANPALVKTHVTIDPATETGPSTVEVVANGIASAPRSITIN